MADINIEFHGKLNIQDYTSLLVKYKKYNSNNVDVKLKLTSHVIITNIWIEKTLPSQKFKVTASKKITNVSSTAFTIHKLHIPESVLLMHIFTNSSRYGFVFKIGFLVEFAQKKVVFYSPIFNLKNDSTINSYVAWENEILSIERPMFHLNTTFPEMDIIDEPSSERPLTDSEKDQGAASSTANQSTANQSKNMPHVSKQVSSSSYDGMMITHTITIADKILQVVNATGIGSTEAKNALEMSAGDVNMAIQFINSEPTADPPSVSRKPSSSCSEVVMESAETRRSRHNKRFMDASKMDKNLFSETSGGIQNGVACPECNSFITVSEKGCNVTTCRYNKGHANGQWYHFCFYCKKQTEFPTGHGAIPPCPERVDKATRVSYYQKKGQSGIITTQDDVEDKEDDVNFG